MIPLDTNSDSAPAQTHNFMSIDSFSQLQFTIPKTNSIRLFGKEFGGSDPSTIIAIEDSGSANTATATTIIHEETKENDDSRRKFECNYCCKIFPTSQALGGHQNAHRKERRLHDTRTHVQSLIIHPSSSKPHLHGFTNPAHHHSFTITKPLYHHHHYNPNTSSIIDYNNSIRFCREKASYIPYQTPLVDGKPLLAQWRFPKVAAQHSSTFSGGGSSSWSLHMHEPKPSFQDQVSLDLHL